MKKKDVQIGGRYAAKVSGRLVVVRVTDIRETPPSYGSRRRTRVSAVNERTGRKITCTPQRLRPLSEPAKRIGRIDEVEHLAEGERAVPEADRVYDVQTIDGPPLGVEVTHIFRRGDCIFAKARDGREFPVTGTGNYVLCPRNQTTRG